MYGEIITYVLSLRSFALPILTRRYLATHSFKEIAIIAIKSKRRYIFIGMESLNCLKNLFQLRGMLYSL